MNSFFYFFPSFGPWLALVLVVGAVAAFIVWRWGMPLLLRILSNKFFWIGLSLFLMAFILFAPKGKNKAVGDKTVDDGITSRLTVTVDYIREIQEMTLLRIFADDFIKADPKNAKGETIGFYIRQIRGYADICIDLGKAQLTLNEADKVLTLTLPEPTVRNATLATNYANPDEGDSVFIPPYTRREGSVGKKIDEEAARRAQTRIEQLAASPENMNKAKVLAESIFGAMLKNFGCRVRVIWKVARQTSSNTR